jgi:hypothetical protein
MTILPKAHKALFDYATHCRATRQPLPLKVVNTIRLLERLRYRPQEGDGGLCESKPVRTSLVGCPIPQAKARKAHLEALRMPSNLQAFAKSEEKVMKDLERFRQKIKFNPETGCDEWTGRIDSRGYAVFDVGGRQVRAARWLYQVMNGPIPEGMELSHGCHCRKCVRVTSPGVGSRHRIGAVGKSIYKTEHCICESHKDNVARSARAGRWSGSRNSQSKLSTEEVVLMRKLYAGSSLFSVKWLSELFGVSLRTAYNVINYEVYENVIPDRYQLKQSEGMAI